MTALQSFKQLFAAEAQIAQAVVRHEEKVPQGGPALALGANGAQPPEKGADDVSKGGPDRTIGGNINEDHFGFLQRRLADKGEAMAIWSGI